MPGHEIEGELFREAPRPRTASAQSKSAVTAIVSRTVAAGDTRALDADAVLHLQRTAGNESVGDLLEDGQGRASTVLEPGPGHPLDATVRQSMELSLGHDFGDVRVHDDAAATAAATSVNALAYTVGNDIVFQSGRYDPSSSEGQHVLAHELTHVVQQRSGPVDGTAGADGIRVSNPSDRFETAAAATADAVTGPAVRPASIASPVSPGRTGVQRQTPNEEDDTDEGTAVQTLQRETPDEEDDTDEGTAVQTLQRETPDEEDEEKIET